MQKYTLVKPDSCDTYIASPAEHDECVWSAECDLGIIFTVTDESRNGECIVEFPSLNDEKTGWSMSLSDLRALLEAAERRLTNGVLSEPSRVGLLGGRWWVDCARIGKRNSRWALPNLSVPLITIGKEDESYSGGFAFLISDAATGAECFYIWIARPDVLPIPCLMCQRDQFVLVANDRIAAIDPSTASIAWARTETGSHITVIYTDDDRIFVTVSTGVNTEFILIDRAGRTCWSRPIPSASEFRRESPKIFVNGIAGEQLVIDERTGQLLPND